MLTYSPRKLPRSANAHALNESRLTLKLRWENSMLSMKARIVLLGLLPAFALLFLTGCGQTRVVTKVEQVEVRVPMMVALPADLTARCVEPADPAKPATNAAHATYTRELQSAFKQCAGQVDEIRDRQPNESRP